ncbi:MAG: FAD-dependent oxidoreductase [Acetobacteraceae bacterium]
MTLARRDLIHAVGRVGGIAAVYRTMAAMGLLAVPDAYAGPPPLPPGQNRRIVIIGAGIAGMVLALELRKAGYAPLVLEARSRAGGRNWTLRGGDSVREAGHVQRVAWDAGPHMYFNPGPARLPYHHTGILSYCRDLGVPLEVMSNDNRGALLQSDAAFDGKPQRNRQVVNDIRGYVAELAAKALDQEVLGQAVTPADKDRLRALLRSFGALDKDMAYAGSGRAGYAEPPGGGSQPGVPAHPLDLRAILDAGFWRFHSNFGEGWHQAATMMQPVGGMGHIGEAFGRRLGGTITYGAEVRALRRSGQGARVEWRDAASGRDHAVEARLAVVTVPLPVLRGIAADFAAETTAAIAAADYVPVVKVAFQAERRFWELDDAIYGGISWTSRDVTQVWYPSAGMQQRKGILVGAYIWSDDIGERITAMAPPQRLEATLADGERLHPEYRRHLTRGVSVAWKSIPFSGGGWAEWSREARATHYRRLLQGDGPFLFAGEHMSYVTGWQEGAVRSAHDVLRVIAARMQG